MALSIPSIDLSNPFDVDPGSLSKAIQSLGFLSIKSAQEPSTDQIARLFAISEKFFLEEPTEEKERVQITVENKGWVKMRQEALDATGHPSGDLKEAFNIAKYTNDAPIQPFPSLLQPHTGEIERFMHSCHNLGTHLLDAFAIDMGLGKDYFTSRHQYDAKQSSILRLLYYPPASRKDHGEADIRAGAHSDYGTLTLLFQKDVGGLQILLPSTPHDLSPRWLDAPVSNDSILVNIGDAFDFWTAGRFPSTQHRVAAPRTEEEGGARFSIAYFMHPADDELLVRIPLDSDASDVTDVNQNGRSVLSRFGIQPDAQLSAREWLLKRLGLTYTGRKEV